MENLNQKGIFNLSEEEKEKINEDYKRFGTFANAYINPGRSPYRHDIEYPSRQVEMLQKMKDGARDPDDFVTLWYYALGLPFRSPGGRSSSGAAYMSQRTYIERHVGHDYEIAKWSLEKLDEMDLPKEVWKKLFRDALYEKYITDNNSETEPLYLLIKKKIGDEADFPQINFIKEN